VGEGAWGVRAGPGAGMSPADAIPTIRRWVWEVGTAGAQAAVMGGDEGWGGGSMHADGLRG
jgi:hypothetical protein